MSQDKPKKSGSREAATTLGLFNAVLIVWGAGWNIEPAVNFASEMVPYTVATVTMAFGGKKVQQIREDRQPWSDDGSEYSE